MKRLVFIYELRTEPVLVVRKEGCDGFDNKVVVYHDSGCLKRILPMCLVLGIVKARITCFYG